VAHTVSRRLGPPPTRAEADTEADAELSFFDPSLGVVVGCADCCLADGSVVALVNIHQAGAKRHLVCRLEELYRGDSRPSYGISFDESGKIFPEFAIGPVASPVFLEAIGASPTPASLLFVVDGSARGTKVLCMLKAESGVLDVILLNASATSGLLVSRIACCTAAPVSQPIFGTSRVATFIATGTRDSCLLSIHRAEAVISQLDVRALLCQGDRARNPLLMRLEPDEKTSGRSIDVDIQFSDGTCSTVAC
jgi:hypothetical protein